MAEEFRELPSIWQIYGQWYCGDLFSLQWPWLGFYPTVHTMSHKKGRPVTLPNIVLFLKFFHLQTHSAVINL